MQTDQYEKNGETRYSTKIVVDEFKGTVQFLDKKLEGSAPKKTVKVTTPAVYNNNYSQFLPTCRKQIYCAILLSASFV
jgi:single-stranded DNA-binding protein